jgi:hypothetical protein
MLHALSAVHHSLSQDIYPNFEEFKTYRISSTGYVKVSHAGAVGVVAGPFNGTLTLSYENPPVVMEVHGESDIFLTRQEYYQGAFGIPASYMWSLHLRPTDSSGQMELGFMKAKDCLPDITMAGGFACSVDFNPLGEPFIISASSEQDAFVARYSTLNGQLQGVYTFGGNGKKSVSTVSYRSASGSNQLLAIHFTGEIDVDPGEGEMPVQSAGGRDAVIVRLGTAGQYIWHHHVDTPGDDRVVHMDDFWYSGRIDFAAGINGAGEAEWEEEMYLGALNFIDGSLRAAHAFGNYGPGNRITQLYCSAESFYLAGELRTTADLNPSSNQELMIKPDGRVLFVARYALLPGFRLVFALPTRGSGRRSELAWLRVGWSLTYLYVAGSFVGELQIDPHDSSYTLQYKGERDLFFAVYAPSESPYFVPPPSLYVANRLGGPGDGYVSAVGSYSHYYEDFPCITAVGNFSPQIQLGDDDPLFSTGESDGNHAFLHGPLYLMLSTQSVDIHHDMALDPTPAEQNLYFELRHPHIAIKSYTVYSLTGQQLSTAVVATGSAIGNIDVSNFAHGMYAILFRTNKGAVSKRFLKQ